MSDIASKLTIIAENQQKVYDAGVQSEYDRFWDVYQDHGNRGNYIYAFAGEGWNDETFKPKYDIHISSNAQYMFYNCGLTRINKPIFFESTTQTTAHMFSNCNNLTTIQLLHFSATQNPNDTSTISMFNGLLTLTNVSVSGVITNDLDFKLSPKLTAESALGIINCLAFLYGWGEAGFGVGVGYVYQDEFVGECSLTFHSDVWARINAMDDSERDGYATWQEYISCELGWTS